MGIWAEIKFALNSTLGGHLKPLDKLVEEKSYDAFYNLTEYDVIKNGDNDGEVIVHPKGASLPSYRNPTVKQIIIPNTFTDSGSFKNCTSLRNISLSRRTKNISGGAFENCKSLSFIDLPNSIEKIQSYAFNGCSNLKTVYMGNVKEIGERIFEGCGISSIYYSGTMAQWNAIKKDANWLGATITNSIYAYCTDGIVTIIRDV